MLCKFHQKYFTHKFLEIILKVIWRQPVELQLELTAGLQGFVVLSLIKHCSKERNLPSDRTWALMPISFVRRNRCFQRTSIDNVLQDLSNNILETAAAILWFYLIPYVVFFSLKIAFAVKEW